MFKEIKTVESICEKYSCLVGNCNCGIPHDVAQLRSLVNELIIYIHELEYENGSLKNKALIEEKK